MALTDFLKDIADAIRYTEKSTGEINAQKFAERIRALSGSQPSPGPEPTITVPQTGTWQLKTTTGKKYIIISTDDDNIGNPAFFRLLRTYGFLYTMNIEAENIDKNIGTDDNGTFTDSDAESLFSNDITVKELGKYLIESGLGEVTQHGASSYNLWDSNNLTGTFLDELYENYTSQGGPRTKDELVAEIKLQLAASDISQGAVYVEESRTTIENAIGYPIYALQTWGGSPIAIVDGIECNLNSIKGGEYDYRGHNYVFASPRVGMAYKASHSLYEKTRNYYTVDIQAEIDKIAIGDIEDFFAHMPYNDLGDEALRQMLDVVKANVDAGIVEVVTPTQYYNLGEWVDNPIVSLSLVRSGNINIGDSDIDEAYTITVQYADGTTGNPESDVILDRNSVNTSVSGTYEVKAYYRGFTVTTNIFVTDSSFILPESLKSTDYWFVYSNDTNGNYYCGNATNITEAYISGSVILSFKGPGVINGWKSTDKGQTWTQVTTNRVCYGNAPTNRQGDADGGYAFDDTWNNAHTFILTSNNFAINL